MLEFKNSIPLFSDLKNDALRERYVYCIYTTDKHVLFSDPVEIFFSDTIFFSSVLLLNFVSSLRHKMFCSVIVLNFFFSSQTQNFLFS